MHTIFIYPDVVGQQGVGLVVDDDGFRWSSRRPKGSWSLRGKLVDCDDSSIDDLIKLEDPAFRCTPQQKFIDSLTGLGDDISPPWGNLMGKRDYLAFLKDLVSRVSELIRSANMKYHNETWVHHHPIFQSIEKFSAPSQELFSGEYQDADSFKPRGGFCDRINYNRFGSRTGRLTVSSGPRILTLKRDARKFLRSRWGDNGTLLSFDFSALEVRLMMADASSTVPGNDPYLDLAGVVGLDRSSSKLALISTVYGATEHGLSGSLHTSLEDARKIRDVIFHRYGTNTLVERLRTEYMAHGHIRNRYGRRVEIPDAGDGPLLNSYLQSTGVDASLWGFKQIIERLPTEHAVPVALLHDALIVDCTTEFSKKMSGEIYVPVVGYDGKFPVKISSFNS